MEISKEIKCKVFAMYLGQMIEIDNGGSKGLPRKLIAVGGIDDEEYIKLRLGSAGNGQIVHASFIRNNECKLILKPLSSITDEHIIWVHDTVHNFHEQRKLRPEWAKTVTPPLKEMKDMISNGFAHYKGGYLCDSAVHQYLISKGYDVPLMMLGWKTLEQSGLAIYETQKV